MERIAAAASLADAVYARVREQGLVGRTEREVALALEDEMRRLGAEEPSFPSIVASSERGALPHARPADVPIERDTLVTLDIGARLDGYCSDCTRTWATGELPDDLAEAYALVLARPAGGARRGAAGPGGPRGRRRRARDHRRRRARRALRARPRPRGRAWRSTRRPGCRVPGSARLVAGQRRDRRAGRLPAGARRGADRGSRRGHRGRVPRALSARRRSFVDGATRVQTPLKAAGWRADIGFDGTPSPHPPNAAPRRPRGRRAAGARRRGHDHRPRRQGARSSSGSRRSTSSVGETLTIHGRYFRRGLNKNTVAFKRSGCEGRVREGGEGHREAAQGQAPEAPRERARGHERHAHPDAAEHPRALDQVRQALHEQAALPDRRRREAAGSAEAADRRPRRRLRRRRHQERASTPTTTTTCSRTRRRRACKLDACHVDSDRDGVEDGYEYQSALNLNDDEHRSGTVDALPGEASRTRTRSTRRTRTRTTTATRSRSRTSTTSGSTRSARARRARWPR